MLLFDYAFHAMGSPCRLQYYADTPDRAQAVNRQVSAMVTHLERKYSRYRPDSLLTRINRAAGTGCRIEIDDETVSLLHYAGQCHRESDGLFDVTAGVLRKIWNFKDRAVPDTSDIEAVLPLIGWDKVEWNSREIYLPIAGMELDFGGIVKEYAADAAASLCRLLNIRSGVVELGGDVRVLGAQPEGVGWPVAIRSPDGGDEALAKLEMTGGALASSGDYERYFEINGIRYGHILNPSTGWPVS
ncbi:MAG: FAD:protein FMN transferase, partial [Gammaproteobacteria bacterium]